MMDLTPRQRAMLVEMRVPIWWPEASKAPVKAPVKAPSEAPAPIPVHALAPADVPADVPAEVPTDATASPMAPPATTTKKALPVRQAKFFPADSSFPAWLRRRVAESLGPVGFEPTTKGL